jgi:hypothetical protein
VPKVDLDKLVAPTPPAIKAALEDSATRTAALFQIGRRLERASTAGLKRFADLLDSLSDADIDRMTRYAKALAEWPEDG